MRRRKNKPWELTLPVIDCPGNNTGSCSDLKGAVTLNIVWITEQGKDPHYKEIPVEMVGVNERPSWSQSANCKDDTISKPMLDGKHAGILSPQNFGLVTVEDNPPHICQAPYIACRIAVRMNLPERPAGTTMAFWQRDQSW